MGQPESANVFLHKLCPALTGEVREGGGKAGNRMQGHWWVNASVPEGGLPFVIEKPKLAKRVVP